MTTDRQDKAPPGQDGPASQNWAQDWITIWQSEVNALLADREAQELLRALLTLWASAGSGLLDLLAGAAPDAAAGRATPVQSPRSKTAAAAFAAGRPDAGNGAEIEQLRRRIAELERRFAELEQTASPGKSVRPRRRGTARS